MGVEDTIALWEEEEKAVRGRLRSTPGVARPEEVAGRTGLEMLGAMLAGELPPPPIAARSISRSSGSSLERRSSRAGRRSSTTTRLAWCSGGWVATLLDSAMGCAVHSTLPAGKGYTTLELKVNFVRAVTDAVPLVRAEGKVVHAGSRSPSPRAVSCRRTASSTPTRRAPV